MDGSLDVYAAEITHLTWHAVDLMTWKLMQDAGIEHNRRHRHHWIVAVLPISESDQAALRIHEPGVRKKFERLNYKLIGYEVLIDHANGVVRIVQKQ